MGWFGYGLYDGDGTQTCHINFIKWAIPKLSEDEVFDMLRIRKTKIPEKYRKEFIKGTSNILKKMKPIRLVKSDEGDLIEWQMLLSLYMDNDLIVPHTILVNGILATRILLSNYHVDDFNEPNKRKAALKRFLKKANENSTVKARKEISKKCSVM